MGGIHGIGSQPYETGRTRNEPGNTATVQKGEQKLADLAQRLGHDLNTLIQVNPQISDINNLKPGQDIRLPMGPSPIQGNNTAPPPTMHIDMSKPENREPGQPVLFRAGDASARSLVQAKMQQQAAPSGPPARDAAMPSPQGLDFYTGMPDRNGNLKEIRGWTDGPAKWLQDAFQLQKDFATQKKELQTAVQNFDNTAAKGREKLDAAMKKDIPKGVDKLNKLTNGEVGRLAREYKSERQQASLALHERSIAATESDAALLKVGIAKADIDKRALEIQQKELGQKAAELQSKIDSNGKLVDKVYDIGTRLAKGDFKALAQEVAVDIGKGLVSDILSSEAKAQLAVVKARMEAVDAKLASVTDQQQKDQLNAAKKSLQASAQKIVLAEEKYNYHVNQADQKLDQLVDHEKNHKVSTVFTATRDYNAGMVRAGKQLYDEAGQTTRMLNGRVISQAGDMYKRVEADRREVYRGDAPRDAKQQFMEVSGKMQDYMKKLESWRKDQQPDLDKLQKAQDSLAQGKHLQLVDDAMNTIIDKALEGEDLSKDRSYIKQ